MPVLPRAAWLAFGAITASLFAGGGTFDAGLPAALVAVIGAGTLIGAVVALAWRHMAGAAFLLGLGAVALRAGIGLIAAPAVPTLPLPAGSGPWSAQVVDVSSPAGDQQRAFLWLSLGGTGEDEPPGRWLVYAWLPRHPSLVPGDRLSLRGTLEPPPVDAPGFAGFLAGRGAVGTLKTDAVERLAAGPGAMAAVERLRRAIDEAIGRAIPEPEAGLASGILIGLRERVGRAVADDFTTTGLTHVVAISGWNIALVAGIATGLLRATGLRRRARSLVVLVAIGSYTIVAGAEASVVRAAVMGGVVLLAREGGRPAGAAAALGVACAGLLLADPGMVDDIGLQLSLAATAGLLALGAAAEATVRRLTPTGTPGWLPETLGVSLAAQLATLPLILLHFGRLSLISPLANLLMAPFVPLAMLGAVLGAAAGPFVGIPVVGLAAAPVSLAAWLPLTAMVRSAGLLADVPFASLELPGPLASIGAVLALLALLAALRRAGSRGAQADADDASWRTARPGAQPSGRRTRRLAAGGVGAALVVSLWLLLAAGPARAAAGLGPRRGPGGCHPGRGCGWLTAARGRRGRSRPARAPARRAHPHLGPTHRPRRVDPPPRGPCRGLGGPGAALSRRAHRRDGRDQRRGRGPRAAPGRRSPRHRPPEAEPGRCLPAGSWAGGRALATTRRRGATVPTTNREVNDTSLVLGIAVGSQRVLLMGDLEADRDGQLLAAIGDPGQPWDLLKVAHHGSAGATSRALLAAIRPRVAAISVGADNDYGHPASELLERLAEVGATVWRTDRQGTFSLALDGRPALAAVLP